ncbi:MAG: UDP-N-acetylmuramoyl-tripeptide--D-alanyl-D-alanine ligase [Mariprofundales bacterium]
MVACFSCLELAEATGGVWHDLPINSVWRARVCTDSRQIQAGDVFLALYGDHFDGHDFIAIAVKAGAVAIIGLENSHDLYYSSALQDNNIPYLGVQDTLLAFGNIAYFWRKQYQGTLIAITGSYGKTSVRCMLSSIFVHLNMHVSSTQSNFNNRIGVPQTILNAELNADVWLIECGISLCGEMQHLAAISKPDVSVFTGFACAHTEGLGNIGTIIREKLYLNAQQWSVFGAGAFAQMQDYAISPPVNAMNVDDNKLITWQLKHRCLQLCYNQKQVNMSLILPAAHWAANMTLAVLVACRISKHPLRKVIEGLQNWQGISGRLQALSGIGGSVLLDDSYNANPASMLAALDTLGQLQGRHFVILGDMAELGRQSIEQHTAIIAQLSDLDGVILVGKQFSLASDKLAIGHMVVMDVEAAIILTQNWSLQKNDTVLIKASRSMHLDKVVQALCVYA